MCASMKPGTTQRPEASSNLATFVLAEPGDEAVGDRDVHLEPLLGEDGQHASPTDDEVGRLVSSRHSEPTAEGLHARQRNTLGPVEVLTPRSLDEALRLKAEHPEAVPIQGGTDVMVTVNFDRLRPDHFLNLNEVPELRGWSRENGTLRLGAGLTYTEGMLEPVASTLPALAEASRTVGSPQIRNRGTVGGNLGTASPAGDALPPLLIEHAELELASERGTRRAAALRVPRRPEEERARRRRAHRRRPRRSERWPTDVHESRAPERDGHRRLLPCARGR